MKRHAARDFPDIFWILNNSYVVTIDYKYFLDSLKF